MVDGHELRPVVGVGDSWWQLSHPYIEAATGQTIEPPENTGGTTTKYWLARRWEIKDRIGSGNTIYLSVGGVDELFWEVDGYARGSEWHPHRVAKRVRRLARALVGDSENVVLHARYATAANGYIPNRYAAYISPTFLGDYYRDVGFPGVRVRFFDNDPLHLELDGYRRRINSIKWPTV